MRAFCSDAADVVEIEAFLPAAEARRHSACDGEATRLSGLEWSVVAMAQRETPASLREPGRMAVALRRLFGAQGNTRLADPRLEALRRLAVHAWHQGYALPVSAVKAFLAAGFGSTQLELVLASIAQARTLMRSRA